jgi:hypothetical protein
MAPGDILATDFALASGRGSADVASTTHSRVSTSTDTSRLSISHTNGSTSHSSTGHDSDASSEPKLPPAAHVNDGRVHFATVEDVGPLGGAPADTTVIGTSDTLPPPAAATARARPVSTLVFNNPFTLGAGGSPETLAAPSASATGERVVNKTLVQRARWRQVLFQYTYWFFCLAIIYFVLIGYPLWGGVAYYIW